MSVYNHFQWYYFDLHSTDDFDLICTIHPVPFNSAFHISIVDIYLYKGKRTELHHYFVLPQKTVDVVDFPFRLQLDRQNFISKTANRIQLQACDSRVTLEMDLLNHTQGNETIQASLLPSGYPDDGFYWKVFAPYCSGNARIKFDGREIRLKGPAYHDFNGGELNLKKTLKYWYWGKYAFDGQLFIYGKITTRKQKTRHIALLAGDGAVQMDNNPRRTVKDGKEYYSTQMGEFVFLMDGREQIDAIRFFMSTLDSVFFTKILELVFHLSARIPGFARLHRYMENTRYFRYRGTGQCVDGRPVKTFYEEMFL